MQLVEYLTPIELAELLKCSRMTVYRAIARGELPATRMGRLLRIRREAVDQLTTRKNGEAV